MSKLIYYCETTISALSYTIYYQYVTLKTLLKAKKEKRKQKKKETFRHGTRGII